MNTLPMNLDELSKLDLPALRALHAGGHCPAITDFQGDVDGVILGAGLLGRLRIWRGKHFAPGAGGDVTGFNRIGFGPLEIRRYRFEARPGPSHFATRDVLLLDHDKPGNPDWVRAHHDELVEVSPGLYLATSHQWRGDRLRFRAYFALAILALHH